MNVDIQIVLILGMELSVAFFLEHVGSLCICVSCFS